MQGFSGGFWLVRFAHDRIPSFPSGMKSASETVASEALFVAWFQRTWGSGTQYADMLAFLISGKCGENQGVSMGQMLIHSVSQRP